MGIGKYSLLVVITVVFITTGLIVPAINEEYDSGVYVEDSDGFKIMDSKEAFGWTDYIEFAFWDVFVTTPKAMELTLGDGFIPGWVKMFFFTISGIPDWLGWIYFMLRVFFWFIVVDLLWLG